MIAIATTDVVLIIGVTTTSVISIIGAFYGKGTKDELKTANSRTIGQQVDANTSARYVLIPVEERTAVQSRHLLDVPPEGLAAPRVEPEGNPTTTSTSAAPHDETDLPPPQP